MHDWIPWIGGYSATFARACIQEFGGEGRVYDPFAGVGTTLLAARELGRNSVGIELNPYAALATKVKCAANKVNAQTLTDIADEVEALRPQERSSWKVPSDFGTRRPFFSDAVSQKVASLLSWLERKQSLEHDFVRLAFGATLVGFSNYSYEPSLSSRVGAGKPEIEDAQVFQKVASKVRHMADGAREWAARYSQCDADTSVTVANSLTTVPTHSRDLSLVLTSPPYLNNYHYVRNTRPQLYLLSLVKGISDLRLLQADNFGGYWQEVRTGTDPAPTFTSCQIHNAIRALRCITRKSGAYSGIGWARYATKYFNDSVTLLTHLRACLRPDAQIVLILGNSVIQGVPFAVDRMVADIATEIGLRVEGIAVIRHREQGNKLLSSSVRSARATTSLYEAMVVIKRT